MKARLIKQDDRIKLLCYDGSIVNQPANEVILDLFYNFKEIEKITGTDGSWKNDDCDIAEITGSTIAFVNDYNNLTIADSTVFAKALLGNTKYISAPEYAKKHNKSVEIIKVYLRQGRIYGAKKVGNSWIVPEDAPYPAPHF